MYCTCIARHVALQCVHTQRMCNNAVITVSGKRTNNQATKHTPPLPSLPAAPSASQAFYGHCGGSPSIATCVPIDCQPGQRERERRRVRVLYLSANQSALPGCWLDWLHSQTDTQASTLLPPPPW